MCEFRLGREDLAAGSGPGPDFSPTPISVDEIIVCLKRIQKSVKMWGKRGGRRGYLSFVEQYVF